ncbi:MAG: restriction endonuclease [Candidatus Aenigmatarchaeota archaeon]
MEKGRELESKIERFFQFNGYKTQRNVILEGKSGGKHEVDVLAEKSNGVTTFRLMVECKAWDKPIEKDVVLKVSYILRDLGLNKAIIVSLKGWRMGAEKSAKELGVELWGQDEIEEKLGRIAIAELETIKFKKIVKGFPQIVKEEQIKPIIESESKGIIGFGREEIVWSKLVWLPSYLFQISYSREEGVIRKSIKTIKVWNLYEAIMGSCFLKFENEPFLKEIEVENIIQPKIKPTKIKNNIVKILEKYLEVITPKAKQRYADILRKMGIPLPVTSVSIDKITEIFYPFYISLFRKGEKERIIAIDCVDGSIDKTVGSALTSNLSYIKESLKV